MGDANPEKNKQNEPHQNITKSTCKVHAIYQPPNQRPKNHQPQQNVRLIKTTAQENTSNNHPGPIIPTSNLINKFQQQQLIPTIIPQKIIPNNSSVPIPRNQPKDRPRNHPIHHVNPGTGWPPGRPLRRQSPGPWLGPPCLRP